MGTFGTITGVDGSTITLSTTDRRSGTTSTVTVKATDQTTISETVTGSVSDLATGDNVVAMGTTAGGVLTAQRVIDTGGQAGAVGGPSGGMAPGGPDGQGPGRGDFTPPTTGTVSSVDGSTITVETSSGSVKVQIGSDATVSLVKTIELGDLAKGDTISVQGDTSGTTVTAASIRKGQPEGGAGFRPGG